MANFSTSVATPHTTKFTLIIEPNPTDGTLSDPILNLACLDSSLAIKPIFEKFKSVKIFIINFIWTIYYFYHLLFSI